MNEERHDILHNFDLIDGDDDDGTGEINFQQQVMAEGMRKNENLNKIASLVRQRSATITETAISSMDGMALDPDIDDSEHADETTAVQKEFFQRLESYPASIDFQRVHIGKTDEPVEQDVAEACVNLSKCMEIREKWVGAHPEPPQDKDVLPPVSLRTPDHIRRKRAHSMTGEATEKERAAATAATKKQDSFRRRKDLPYDVFSLPVPDFYVAHEFATVMRHGVIQVVSIANTPTLGMPPTGEASGDRETGDGARGLARCGSSENMTARASEYDDGSHSENDFSNLPPVFPILDFDTYVNDFNFLKKAIYSGNTGSYSFQCLEVLSAKFNLHVLLNSARETEAQKSVPHRDFYNVRKVDTHVHHSACMNQKHLLRFIKSKLKNHPNEVVIFRDGNFLTLGEVFKSLKLTAYDLSIDTLDMHANNTFHRFDRFNLKYNPAGKSKLREIFLKTDNVIGGRYLAEITREVIADLEASKYSLVEWRVSIYGKDLSEWDLLSRWFYVHKLAHTNVRWLIQIPRLYHLYRKDGSVKSFEDMLYNIFAPLYHVSMDPSSNPALHYFLQTIVAFDSVDDESRPEASQLVSGMPEPHEWTSNNEPPYSYWMYYLYINIQQLNSFRASLNLNTFQLRPHCGEAGDIDHLIAAYICSHQINHGILLRKLPALQHLYYLSQVGIAISPLSNNKLFLDYNKNPFPKYFRQGLNVSLSTDDPLMLHYTKDALVEEYSVAAQVWKFSSTDQNEIARNSVLQSGWEKRFKKHFLGDDFADTTMTNVPVIRLKYREETLAAAINDIKANAACYKKCKVW
jgi:AMP deaminase